MKFEPPFGASLATCPPQLRKKVKHDEDDDGEKLDILINIQIRIVRARAIRRSEKRKTMLNIQEHMRVTQHGKKRLQQI